MARLCRARAAVLRAADFIGWIVAADRRPWLYESGDFLEEIR